MINVITITADGAVTVGDIDQSLSTLQEIIGGYIQYVPLLDAPGFIVVDEEGMLKKLKPNRIASTLTGQLLVGTAVVIGPADSKGDDTSVTVAAIRAVAKARR